MRRSSVMRYVYGVALIAAAIGFALPIIDAGLLGSYNGFQLGKMLGTVPQICFYVMFALFCIGGIIAFVPKTTKYDLLFFCLIIIDIVSMVIYFLAGKKGGSSALWNIFGESITKLIFNLLQPGAWIFAIGFVVAIVAFILKPKR